MNNIHVQVSTHFLNVLDDKLMLKYKYCGIPETLVGFRQYGVFVCAFVSIVVLPLRRVLTWPVIVKQ